MKEREPAYALTFSFAADDVEEYEDVEVQWESWISTAFDSPFEVEYIGLEFWHKFVNESATGPAEVKESVSNACRLRTKFPFL